MKIVDCHFNDHGGRRLYVVVSLGPRWVNLLNASTLRALRVARAEYEKSVVREIDDRKIRSRVAKRIKATRRQYERLGVPITKGAVARALAHS